MPESIINVSYIVAAILFILGIKMLGSATTAVKGNRISSLGMLIAIIVTLSKSGLDYGWIVAGLAVGGAIGLIAAKRVQMTGMPE
ncbi:MAG: NAD(P)(+) transhydrogenase (Re/Si-specific) subunit beta, partial [Verrucomicrobiales bacterium]|nr:NAD(P)(+) transhydrogenase (Re/Si-specific) subunit beta [Verrucomicrobiales bacterium]